MKNDKHVRLAYSAPLDGVRAIAIAAVLIVHAYPEILIGGFTGVDVFFVISGYLITSIILQDLRSESFSLAEFYLRRVQRLLPNLVVTVFTVILMWTFLLPPGMASEPGRHGLWAVFNLSNIYCWQSLGGYWGNRAEWAPLTHTWSLGIEEQFYLIFPACLIILHRFQPGRILIWLTVAALGSLGLCLYGTAGHATATFYLLPTRGWELLVGAILAAFQTGYSPREKLLQLPHGMAILELAGWIGLGLIIIGYVTLDGGAGFPGLKALIPTAGTLLLLFSIVNANTRVAQLFSNPVMVLVGRQSYSIYLWHWPLMIMGKLQAELFGLPHHVGSIAGGLAGLLFAWLAYALVEQPLRNRGPGRSRRLAYIAAGIGATALSCLFAMQQTEVDRGDRFEPLAVHSKIYNAGRDTTPVRGVAFSDVTFPPVEDRTAPPWRTGGVIHRHGSSNPSVVVLGSSHATMYSRLIDDICRERGISVAFLGVNQTSVVFRGSNAQNPNFSSESEFQDFNKTWPMWLHEWHPKLVFIIERWDQERTSNDEFESDLRSFFAKVGPLAEQVMFVAQAPVTSLGEMFNLRAYANWRINESSGLPILKPDPREHLRRQAVAIAEKAKIDFPNLHVLRADLPFYHKDGSVRYAEGRSFFYADDDHLSDVGTEQVRVLFSNAVDEAHPNR